MQKLLKASFLIIAAILVVFMSGCDAIRDAVLGGEEPEEHKPGKVEWGYEPQNGPDVWGQLSPRYVLCSDGINQSPIDIVDATPINLPDIVFNYQLVDLDILNNGHTIQVEYHEGSSIESDGAIYQLLQFHFHAPSEHTVDGEQFEMEMHLVHQSDDDTLAVVGVLIKSGSHNDAFNSVWDNLPADAGEVQHIAGETVNAEDLLPADRLYYRYDGSLTTPDCSEGVKWHVLTTPIEMSDAQIAAFEGIFHDNNRPVQPLNAREILVDSAAD